MDRKISWIIFIFLFLIPFTSQYVFSQSESVEIVPDQYTMALDHFNGSCAENCRYVNFVNSLPGLDRAADFTTYSYSIYQIPWHLCRTINSQGTFEFWIKARQYNVRIVSTHNNYNSGPTYMALSLTRNGRLSYYTWPSGQGTLQSKSPIPLLEWTHIAVSWGPSATKIYINGKLDASAAKNFGQGACTYMGHHFIISKGSDVGLIDEFHISYIERNADEIAQHGVYHDMVPRLTLDMPVSGTIPGGKSVLYKVTAEPGKDLLVTLDQTGTPTLLEFYGRKGNYPSTLRYDLYNPDQAGESHQSMIFPGTYEPVTYYFLVRNSGTGANAPYTILARHPDLYVERVTPSSAGNAGKVTLCLSGCQLTPDIEVKLISPAGISISGSSPLLFDSTEVYAVFDLTGTQTGLYDVKIEKAAVTPITLSEAFKVTPGIGPRLEVQLKAPTIIRSRRQYTLWIEYKNSGDADMPAPLLHLANSGDSQIQIGIMGRKSDQGLYLLGVSNDGPAGVLGPGSSHRIPITFTSLSGPSVKFDLKTYQPDETMVEWESIEPSMRPSLIDDAEWTTYWQTITSPPGITWQQVIENISPLISGLDPNLDYMTDLPMVLDYALGVSSITSRAKSNPVSKSHSNQAKSSTPGSDVHVLWVNGFDPNYDCTYIVTHGWNSNPIAMSPLAFKIRDHCPNCNVALINWEIKANTGLRSWAAAQNTQSAGEAAYKLLKEKVKGYDFSKMIYVGHSFGNVVNKVIAGHEKTPIGKAKGRAVILDPAASPGGLGKYAQPEFANFYEKASTSFSTGSPADAQPCGPDRIADRQLYLSSLSHSKARDCLTDFLDKMPDPDCSNRWLKGNISVPVAGAGLFDGKMNCDGSYSSTPVDNCNKHNNPNYSVPMNPARSSTSTVFRPADPNEKVGNMGTGEPDYFIRPGTEITYTIYFENKPEATAPAQEVFIDDDLDNDLDWSTFRLGEIAFGDKVVTALAGKRSGFTSVMKDEYRVDIEVLFDPDTGRTNWTFRTIDPKTNEWPEDPLAGFLPPNDPDTGSGEGHVTFTIQTKEGLADGTEITNKAGIVFDTEAKIETNTWKNIINSQIVINKPPKANAGEDITILSKDTPNTVIQGTAEDEDPDDQLQYQWKKGNTVLTVFKPVSESGQCSLNLAGLAAPMGVGTHTLTLEVTDGQETSSDDMVLSIKNSPPRVFPGGSGSYETNTPVTLSGTVSDYDGDLLNYQWLEGTTVRHSGSVQAAAGETPVSLPGFSVSNFTLGQHTIVLKASDGINDPATGEIKIEIVDTTPPTLAPFADKTTLWPPNHKMVDISIKANAEDNSGLPVTLTVSVSSSEPAAGLDKGDKSPDWTEPVIDRESGTVTLKLRAERSGKEKTGRTYTITVTAADTSDNRSSAKVEIVVPHDKKE